MLVRNATDGDAEAIAVVHVSSWRAAYRGLIAEEILDGLSVADRAATWRGLLRDGATTVLVADEEEALAGFCALTTPSRDADAGDGVAEIGALYVDPRRWRAGIGRALMTAALEALRTEGWRMVTLWVLVGNAQARAFYARFGFRPDGTRTPGEPGEGDEVRLRAPVDAADSAMMTR